MKVKLILIASVFLAILIALTINAFLQALDMFDKSMFFVALYNIVTSFLLNSIFLYF